MKRRLSAIGDHDPELRAVLVSFFGATGSFDEQLRLAELVLATVYGEHLR